MAPTIARIRSALRLRGAWAGVVGPVAAAGRQQQRFLATRMHCTHCDRAAWFEFRPEALVASEAPVPGSGPRWRCPICRRSS